MIRSRFRHILAHPEEMNSDDVSQLEKLSQQYPWFGQAKVMIAKALQDQDDHRAQAWVKQAAALTSNRKLLKHFLVETDFKEALLKKHEELEAFAAEEDSLAATDSLRIEEEKSSELEHVKEGLEAEQELANATTYTPANDQTQQAEEALEAAKITEQEKALNSQEEAIPPTNEILEQNSEDEEEEQEVQTDEEEALGNEAEENNTNDDASAPLKVEELNEEILVAAISTTIGLEADEYATEGAGVSSEAEVSALQKETEPLGEENKLSYGAWLRQRSSALGYETAPEEVKTQEDSPATTPPKSKQDIIDRFIKTQPQISRLKASDELVSAADKSLQEDDTLVTETLAEIYAAQGHMKKALKAYERLGLAYPEKSVYFAARIKKLKERHK